MNTILPQGPFDGQEWVDAFRVKWVYNAEDSTWTRVGVVTDVPVARGENDPAGPTYGLLSAADKAMIDAIPPKAGGFGLILKPGYYLTQDGVDNVLQGDVSLVSDTLKFTCTQAGTSDSIPSISIGLSDDFLESYAIEVRGTKGPKGEKGPRGLPGRPGTGDGPQGDPGEPGKDATPHTFSGIIYEELDEIYDTAVVGLKLDAANGILEVTKAKMDVPDENKPATRVIATPVIRDVRFNGTGLDSWQLVSPDGDPVSEVDLNIIRLPKGWVGSENPIPVSTIKLSKLVGSIIDYYAAEAEKVAAKWDQDLKAWVVDHDKAARTVLHNLASELAEAEFQLPLEFCLGIEPVVCESDINPPNPDTDPDGDGCLDTASSTPAATQGLTVFGYGAVSGSMATQLSLTAISQAGTVQVWNETCQIFNGQVTSVPTVLTIQLDPNLRNRLVFQGGISIDVDVSPRSPGLLWPHRMDLSSGSNRFLEIHKGAT